jgi:hypothetical protein
MSHRQQKFSHIHNDPVLDLIQGTRSDMTNNIVEGVSKSLANGVNKVLWNENSAFHYVLNANMLLNIVSSHANDNASGAGARTVLITGLVYSNPSSVNTYTTTSITVTLNGTTQVQVATAFYRVLSLKVLTTGSHLLNKGDLKVLVRTTATVVSCMEADSNISNQCIVSPPTNSDTLIEKLHISGHFDTECEIHINKLEESVGIQHTPYKFFIGSNGSNISFPIRMKVEAGETVWVSVLPIGSVIGTHNHICGVLECTNRSVNSIVPSFN